MSFRQRKTNSAADGNQGDIVSMLREIPGVMVSTAHDDILVGYRGRTYWFEIKSSKDAPIRPGQKKLREEWPGHYKIIWTLDMILEDMGIKST